MIYEKDRNGSFRRGSTDKPGYETVGVGITGHAKVVRIEFQPEIISFKTLLEVFFELHDSTTLNRQGADAGTQYRSVILFTNDKQKTEAEKYKNKIPNSNTEIINLDKFYPAETYHENYYEKNSDYPYCQLVISPKLNKLRQKFENLLS